MLLVWEPVRAADEIGPPRGTYARVTDRRVRQFWDRDRILSQRMVRDLMENPKLLADTTKVTESTIIWDIAAVFPPRTRWDSSLPRPSYYGRPVAAVVIEMERAVEAAIAGKP